MKQITCNFCGDTYPDFDVAHVCSSGQYAPKLKSETNTPIVSDNLVKFWADPRFQILADVDKLLDSSKIWDGMEWSYHPIHPFKYRPIAERIRAELDKLKAEYGLEK